MVLKSRKNYYNILGVNPDSETDEVKSAYRALARKYHPDINKTPESVQKFKDVLEAYETLSDKTKRSQYDMVNGFYKSPQMPPPHKKEQKNRKENTPPDFKETLNSRKNSYNRKGAGSGSRTASTDDVYNKKFFKKTMNSILDEISRNHQEKRVKESPKNGEDIYTDISVTLQEAVNGTERVLNIMHKELCPRCRGHRFINGTKCSSCGGTGVYELKRKITVKIPAGVKNNSKLRLIGEGNPGFWGGSCGNLYIKIKIEKNSNMETDGNNILYKLSITPFEAVLGGNISIPALDRNLSLTIPPMTNSGQKFRLANQGLKTNGRFGDMIVTVEIQIPKNLSQDEIKMYEKLKKMSKEIVRENTIDE